MDSCATRLTRLSETLHLEASRSIYLRVSILFLCIVLALSSGLDSEEARCRGRRLPHWELEGPSQRNTVAEVVVCPSNEGQDRLLLYASTEPAQSACWKSAIDSIRFYFFRARTERAFGCILPVTWNGGCASMACLSLAQFESERKRMEVWRAVSVFRDAMFKLVLFREPCRPLDFCFDRGFILSPISEATYLGRSCLLFFREAYWRDIYSPIFTWAGLRSASHHGGGEPFLVLWRKVDREKRSVSISPGSSNWEDLTCQCNSRVPIQWCRGRHDGLQRLCACHDMHPQSNNCCGVADTQSRVVCRVHG